MYDIVIVGASFAGLTLAHYLPRNFKILVVDNKAQIGLPTKSTGLITQATKDMISEFFDVDRFITNKMNALCVVSPNYKDYFVSSVEQPWIYTTDTDNMIKELADKLPDNVEVQTNRTFLGYDLYPLKVSFDKGQEVYARFIVGADGGSSSVARSNPNLDQNKKFLIGVEKIVPGKILLTENPEKTVYHYWFGDFALGYGGWIAPTIVDGDPALRIGFALYPNEISKRVTVDRFISLLKVKGHIEVYGKEVASFANHIPIGGPLRKFYDKHSLLIGDAAGYCGSFAADGIKGAIMSAKKAAKAIPKYFSGDKKALASIKKEMPINYYDRQKIYRKMWDTIKTRKGFLLLYKLVEREKSAFLKTYCDSKDKQKSLLKSIIKIKNIPTILAIGVTILIPRKLRWSRGKRLRRRAHVIV